MVFARIMTVNGNKYFYLEKSMRIGKNTLKTSKFLGKREEISESRLKEELKKFTLEVDDRFVKLRENFLKKNILSLEYPLTWDEINKLEAMNFKYHQIMSDLRKEDITDIKKRFVANFVFESNAIEGNSLTLKNYNEIIFENRIAKGADLREVYDAQNSYKTFLWLFKSREELKEKLILKIHKKIMKNIDSRAGYKSVPNIILGSKVKLSLPEDVPSDIQNLLFWYEERSQAVVSINIYCLAPRSMLCSLVSFSISLQRDELFLLNP